MARSEKDISFWDDFEDESAEPDDITLAYVAGLFDGEGSVGVGIDYKVRITLCNTDEKVIKWLKSLFGGCASDWDKKGTRKTIYTWKLNASKATRLLSSMLPYLRIKRERALLAIAFQNTQFPRKVKKWQTRSSEETEYRKLLYERLRELNRRGKGGIFGQKTEDNSKS